jgi:hypothetical protein
MNAITKIPKKQFYTIMIILGVLITSLSLETMMKVKDLTLYESWFASVETDLSYNDAFSVYVTANLALYAFKVIVPMMFGLHTYLAFVKIRINKLYVFIWTVLLAGSLGYIIVSRSFDSVFYYINIVSCVLLIGAVLTLVSIIDERKIA